jgi:hypothetical protein
MHGLGVTGHGISVHLATCFFGHFSWTKPSEWIPLREHSSLGLKGLPQKQIGALEVSRLLGFELLARPAKGFPKYKTRDEFFHLHYRKYSIHGGGIPEQPPAW